MKKYIAAALVATAMLWFPWMHRIVFDNWLAAWPGADHSDVHFMIVAGQVIASMAAFGILTFP